MNLTVTPLNQYNRPVFKANIQKTAEQLLSEAGSQESGLFAPLNKVYEKVTDKIADKFTSRLVNFGPLNYLAEKFKDSKNLYQHTLTVGSVITSGLYMQRTYTNKNLDKDRRNTLVVNQGLTLAVSTAGAYLLDKYLKTWWDDVTARFAGHLLNDKDFYKNFKEQKNAINAENKALLNAAKDGIKPELKSLPRVDKLIKKHSLFKALTEKNQSILMDKIKGIGLMRSMIVFGFVYRYFVPVAVTKPANKLCDMYLEHKKAKAAQQTQKA